MYSGSYMRAYKILPKSEYVRAGELSQEAKKRLDWIDWYYSHGKKVRATLRHFSLSPDVFYRYLKKFNPYRLETLEDDKKTRTPHHLREMTTPPHILQKIYDLRLLDLEKSKYEIHEELLREGLKVAHNVIQKVINRHPELRNSQHKSRVKKHRHYVLARLKAARELRERHLGSLVQIDTKHLYVLGKRHYLFAAIDCKSRYAYVWAYPSGSSASAADFLRKVIHHFPFKVVSVNTDNGSEYLLHFHKLCQHLGLTHYFNYPHSPKMNGRVERFIQTAELEFFNYQEDLLDDLTEINQRCEVFNYKYNYQRFHQSLDYQTPGEYVKSIMLLKGAGVT